MKFPVSRACEIILFYKITMDSRKETVMNHRRCYFYPLKGKSNNERNLAAKGRVVRNPGEEVQQDINRLEGVEIIILYLNRIIGSYISNVVIFISILTNWERNGSGCARLELGGQMKVENWIGIM